MARLNDLPAPTESIEALKRRFVRQNREIARANSIQSLRIQSLESEISHLLHENAVLRGQVISLSQDVEKFEAAKLVSEGIRNYKERLANKVAELDSLVNELEAVSQKSSRSTEDQKDVVNVEESQSSAVSVRRTGLNNAGSEEGRRLPVILEDKYFPRRTLEPQELEDIANTTSDPDSPRIGPPPIAHLDADQSFSPEPLRSNTETNLGSRSYEENDLSATSSLEANLTGEKKPFHQQINPTKSTTFSNSDLTRPLVKSGSKRKFNARDDDDKFESNTSILDDDFQFSRAVNIQRSADLETEMGNPETLFTSNQNNIGKGSTNGRTPKRKALEPKTTNMRPNPSKKQNAAKVEGQQKPAKGINMVDNIQTTTLIQASLQPDPDSRPNCDVPEDDSSNPTSTATSIAPNTDTVESLSDSSNQMKLDDTSRPGNQDSTRTIISVTGYSSRPARRPRATVSYAEPNLRDKMRRPTNELVDAVLADRFRRTSASQADKRNDPGASSAHIRNMVSATEEESNTTSFTSDDTTCKKAFVLHDVKFHGLSEIPTTVITERKRRTLSANEDDLAQSQNMNTMRRSAYAFIQDEKEASEREHPGACQRIYSDRSSRAAQGSAEILLSSPTSNESEIVRGSINTHRFPGGPIRRVRRHSSNTDGIYRDISSRKDQLDRFQRKQLVHSQGLGYYDQPSNGEQKQRGRPSNEGESYAREGPEDAINIITDRSQVKRSQRAAARRRSMML